MNRFEDAVHTHRRDVGELSVDDFGDAWERTQTAMLGDAVELTPGYRTWWSYIPHFIGSPGYVYAYAYGQLLALAVYARYEAEGASFVPAYLDLLRAGGSMAPAGPRAHRRLSTSPTRGSGTAAWPSSTSSSPPRRPPPAPPVASSLPAGIDRGGRVTTSTMATEVGLDLTDRELYRHGVPYERLAFLRDEPVWWHPPTPGVEELRPTGFYVVARHDVIREVSRDPQRFSAFHGSALRDVPVERQGESITNSDPPVQSRFRRLVSLGFTPRMVAVLDEMMEGWARRIVDDLAGRDRCEFVTEVAEMLPLHVIADIVGIPVDERAQVFDDTKAMLRSWDPESGVPFEQNRDAQMRLLRYAHVLSSARRGRAGGRRVVEAGRRPAHAR